MRNLSRDTGSDFECLAQRFEDINLDTGSGNEPQNRLMTILDASSDATHGGITHSSKPSADAEDRGFRQAFQDPHPSSRNQVGHFMTAVDMGYGLHQTLR